jgi:hypothetical protein
VTPERGEGCGHEAEAGSFEVCRTERAGSSRLSLVRSQERIVPPELRRLQWPSEDVPLRSVWDKPNVSETVRRRHQQKLTLKCVAQTRASGLRNLA